MISGKGVVHSERGRAESLDGYVDELPRTSHGLQLWVALPKDGEDVESSFHAGHSVVIRDDQDVQANLVVGSYRGHTVCDIPLDTRMGCVMFVDALLRQQGSTFNIAPDDGGETSDKKALELGIYLVSGAADILFDDKVSTVSEEGI